MEHRRRLDPGVAEGGEGALGDVGDEGLTLPTPHGTTLKVPYVRLIIRKIEEAELLAHEEEDREDQDP